MQAPLTIRIDTKQQWHVSLGWFMAVNFMN